MDSYTAMSLNIESARKAREVLSERLFGTNVTASGTAIGRQSQAIRSHYMCTHILARTHAHIESESEISLFDCIAHSRICC